jgi:hypothetical protein
MNLWYQKMISLSRSSDKRNRGISKVKKDPKKDREWSEVATNPKPKTPAIIATKRIISKLQDIAA